jgi:hypothetical protein
LCGAAVHASHVRIRRHCNVLHLTRGLAHAAQMRSMIPNESPAFFRAFGGERDRSRTTQRTFSHKLLALFAMALCALLALPRDAHAQRRHHHDGDGDDSLRAPAVRVVYVDRPITATFRHLDLYFGLGFEYTDYYRSYPAVGHGLWGLGAHLDLSYGITRWLELGAGISFRYAEDRNALAFVTPDQYARVNREWLPTALELARVPFSLGADYVTNPFVHGRIAFLNRPPVLVGLDLYLTAPIIPQTCFVADIGVPLHFAIAHRVRIETGVFNEFLPCVVQGPGQPGPLFATDYWTLMVPLRVLFQITPRFWLGLRTGFESVGYRFDGEHIAIPLGFQGGVRLIPRLDLLFQIVAPEFVHIDPVTRSNVWFNRIGTGVAIQAWLF